MRFFMVTDKVPLVEQLLEYNTQPGVYPALERLR
jgi:hypothetical protein